MYNMLCQLEDLIILKTIMEFVDLDSISISDLEEIAMYAEEFNIDLGDYHSDSKLIHEIYFEWFENVNTMYLNVKNGLLRLI